MKLSSSRRISEVRSTEQRAQSKHAGAGQVGHGGRNNIAFFGFTGGWKNIETYRHLQFTVRYQPTI